VRGGCFALAIRSLLFLLPFGRPLGRLTSWPSALTGVALAFRLFLMLFPACKRSLRYLVLHVSL
jgi:hypothetical protein